MEATCSLYGLIHARYVLTTAGLEAMYAKYTLQVRRGRCLRVLNRGLFQLLSCRGPWLLVWCEMLRYSSSSHSTYFEGHCVVPDKFRTAFGRDGHDEHDVVITLVHKPLLPAGVANLACLCAN